MPFGYTGDATAAVIGQIERFAPGFRDRIVATVSKSTAELEAYNHNYVGGDIIGGANDGLQSLFRPRISVDPYFDRRTRGLPVLAVHATGCRHPWAVRLSRRGIGAAAAALIESAARIDVTLNHRIRPAILAATRLAASISSATKERHVTVRVGINGFGRIGRNFYRALLAQQAAGPDTDIEIDRGQRPDRQRHAWRTC